MTPVQIRHAEDHIRGRLEAESGGPGDLFSYPRGRPDLGVCHGEGYARLLTRLVNDDYLAKLTELGLGQRINGFWSLALRFGSEGWATFEIHRVLTSDWSGERFVEPTNPVTWPEGVLLDPQEVDIALNWETDLIGVVVQGGPDCLVLCFDVYGNHLKNLRWLAKKLDREPEFVAEYMSRPRPARKQPMPVAVLQVSPDLARQPYLFTPRRPGLAKRDRAHLESRLFKHHWVVRTLRPAPKPPAPKVKPDG